jgi:hypothetical protein
MEKKKSDSWRSSRWRSTPQGPPQLGVSCFDHLASCFDYKGRTVHLLQTTVGAVVVAPHGTPDSPVAHRTVR